MEKMTIEIRMIGPLILTKLITNYTKSSSKYLEERARRKISLSLASVLSSKGNDKGNIGCSTTRTSITVDRMFHKKASAKMQLGLSKC